MADSSEPDVQVPAVLPPSADLHLPVVVVPQPPVCPRRLVQPTVIPRRIGTCAHPLADAPSPVPIPTEIVAITMVSYQR